MGKPQSYKGENGKTLWRVQYKFRSRRRTFRLGSIRESTANKIVAKLDNLFGSARHGIEPDADTIAFFCDEAPEKLFRQLEKMGALDHCPRVIEARQPAKEDDESEMTVAAFVAWYVEQRKSDCEPSSVRKIKASLNQFLMFVDRPRKTKLSAVDSPMAFKYQLHRRKERAESTASKDIKILKTAFKFAVNAGFVTENPFSKLKNGSEVNPDGQTIIRIEDYEKMMNTCTDTTWKVIISLVRIGGLRAPSEFVGLKWKDVDWEGGKIRVSSPKTKRHGKTERTIPLFRRLETVLREHWERTGADSEYIIDKPALRRKESNLRTTFQKLRECAGVEHFANPFRNMRLSAANDVCRLEGITMKTVTEWFGHDITTALKHYHRVTDSDFDLARTKDPFASRVKKSDAKSDARTPKNEVAQERKNEKNAEF